ncbi:Ulp1-like peptidase [Cucumis melo var. makuwa]|uniref:Ulp1-like peptidase n=1 Tax=Cucumis melo var. makuwa TaxID=1194695 RepID=A0A5D3DR48_CUCMM|nr:Ulp1-like peptidase [Cucumis melo var. makuwa]TYK25760.1 Ulp1-like peptidase [Cucumis melo var. makuwa]
MLQKNIFDNKNSIVQAKLKLSTQEKSFMESRIRGDVNMEMEDDESMPDIDNSDNTTPDDTTNNQSLDTTNNLQSTSSPQLSPRKKKDKHQKAVIAAVENEANTGKIAPDNDDIHHFQYDLHDGINQDNMDKNDDHQNREDMMSNDQPYVEEQDTQDHNMETQREHQEESSSDISIDGRDADLLLTIRDISDNLNAQKEDLEYYFNTVVGDFQEKPGWGDVNYVIGCINIKEHSSAVAAVMRKCEIYVSDSMPNYIDKKLVDPALEMLARCIASLAIAIGVDLHSK